MTQRDLVPGTISFLSIPMPGEMFLCLCPGSISPNMPVYVLTVVERVGIGSPACVGGALENSMKTN